MIRCEISRDPKVGGTTLIVLQTWILEGILICEVNEQDYTVNQWIPKNYSCQLCSASLCATCCKLKHPLRSRGFLHTTDVGLFLVVTKA